jgi:hypothetical protein
MRSNKQMTMKHSLVICKTSLLIGAALQSVGLAAGSRIEQIHGIPTLVVDEQPFFVLGAQCDIWRSVRQDARTLAFFDGYQKMNATAVGIGIPWARIEQSEGHYDFAFLDWFIRRAEQRGLKLVVNLFNSNVCGKVRDPGLGVGANSGFTPDYVLAAPQKYQRMVLGQEGTYDSGGPPMCPNDPRTLDRERRYVVQVARHLQAADVHHTVIMLQIDNEFYYQQWVPPGPKTPKAVRCHCRWCEEKYARSKYPTGEAFMFHSFARYVKELTDAIHAEYDVPMYVNSPWWPPYIVPIFLEAAPHLSLVGVDGIFDPGEPNVLSRSQLGRNIPFAAENPTEHPDTRFNLDVLPYYTLVGREGIGNLLWECGPPHTVVDDPLAAARYGDALYPLRHAMAPIAEARGSEHLAAWYAVRRFAPRRKNASGNFIEPAGGRSLEREQFFLRQGRQTRLVEPNALAVSLGRWHFAIHESPAGIVLEPKPDELVLAIPKGRIVVTGGRIAQIEEGRFVAADWHADRSWKAAGPAGQTVLNFDRPKVIRFRGGPPAPGP